MQRFVPRDNIPWRHTDGDDAPDVEDEMQEGVSSRQRGRRSGDAELAAELEEVRRERDRYLELAKHSQSELENFRRRTAREQGMSESRALAKLVLELVPILDHFEMALTQAGVATDDGDGDDPVARGVLMIYRELARVIERLGVKTISPGSEPFDPVFHEAMMTREADGVEPGTVLEVISQGYMVADQVLRPARVVVAQ